MAASGTSIHILGGGALGLLFGTHLARAGHRVTLLLRDEALAAFRAREREREGGDGGGGDDGGGGVISVVERDAAAHSFRVVAEATVRAEPADPSSAGSARLPPIENLVVATKAPAAAPALRALAPRLCAERSSALLLCNGVLAVRDELLSSRPRIPLARLLVASVSHGAYRVPTAQVAAAAAASPLSQFSVVRAGVGECVMGELGGGDDDDGGGQGNATATAAPAPPPAPPPPLALALESAGAALGARWEPDRESLRHALLAKLAVNCAANAAAGLLRCRNGGMLPEANPAAGQLQRRVVGECVAALGLEGGAEGAEAAAAAQQQQQQLLLQTVARVLSQTRGNVNSLLQDLLAARPTEVDYLNGWVAKQALRKGLSAPVNEALALLVRACEGVPAADRVGGGGG